MKRYLLQLGVAISLSLSVLLGTLYWYKKATESTSNGNNIDIVADVNQITNEVERKPVNSLIWKTIDRSDLIYDGEAIRTLSDSHIKIYFRENNSYLDLEPESLIVIKKSKGEIALDLMEGSIMVAKESDKPDGENSKSQSNSPTASLVLNSKKGKIDLSQATASLSKSSGEEINLQVIKGNASLTNEKGEQKELQQGTTGVISDKTPFQEKKFTIVSPDFSKKLYTTAEKKLKIPFKWKGFGKDSWVELWIGSSPKNLKKFNAVQNVNSEGEISVELPAGKHFWKLLAREASTQGNSNAKNENSAYAGQSPINKTEIELRYAPVVEGPPHNSKVIANQFPTHLQYSVKDTSPFDKIILDVSTDVNFKKEVTTYKIKKEKEIKVELPAKGKYFWKYSTYFPESQEPLVSSTLEFNALTKAEDITPIDLAWDLSEKEGLQYYVTEPKLKLKWKPTKSSPNVKFWRVKYKEANSQVEAQTTQIEATQLSSQSPLTKPGRYIASIEAVDSENRILGSTPEKEIGVQELPLIKTPHFLNQEPTIQSKPNGEVYIQWTPVTGAKEYWIQILKGGTELKKQNYQKTETTVRKLKPGEYEVQLYAEDEFHRKSIGSDKRKLVVPELNDLKAPKLLKMSIKK